jgi:single-stranded-DNA-specific exonuclease
VPPQLPQEFRRSSWTTTSGYGVEPQPTSSLLAYRCASATADVDDLLWLAAIGIIGDMAEASGFPEMAEARRRYGVTVLRKVASLVNRPRPSASGDPTPALSLLLKCRGPKEVLSGEHPETAALIAAQTEVKAELERVRRVAPKAAGGVALIRFASPCQVHPLVAQTWTGRIRDRIVLAANTGFRPGWVHFAARSAGDVDLVVFLARHAPPGADENYGSGHRKASGGALRLPDWNSFVRGLGFGPEMEVA